MINFKYILKKEGITLKQFAGQLGVSRPTMYKMLSDYDSGKQLQDPYASIFDAFFLKERNRMKGKYESRNGNLIVKIVENTAENANGTFIKGSETRGKRDIVLAEVVVENSNYKAGTLIYFSFYAAQPFELEGEQVYVVNNQDIKFIKKEGKTNAKR